MVRSCGITVSGSSIYNSIMSGAAAAIYLLDMKGRVLIWRDYRGDVPVSLAERFFAKLMEGEVRLARTDLRHQTHSIAEVPDTM